MRSSEVTFLSVPSQGGLTRSAIRIARLPDLLAVVRVVVLPVLEVLLQTSADLEPSVLRHGHVAQVEQLVDVGA